MIFIGLEIFFFPCRIQCGSPVTSISSAFIRRSVTLITVHAAVVAAVEPIA